MYIYYINAGSQEKFIDVFIKMLENQKKTYFSTYKQLKDLCENYEIIIEFWPQRLFYIGLFISAVALIGCLGFLGISHIKRLVFSAKNS